MNIWKWEKWDYQTGLRKSLRGNITNNRISMCGDAKRPRILGTRGGWGVVEKKRL